MSLSERVSMASCVAQHVPRAERFVVARAFYQVSGQSMLDSARSSLTVDSALRREKRPPLCDPPHLVNCQACIRGLPVMGATYLVHVTHTRSGALGMQFSIRC